MPNAPGLQQVIVLRCMREIGGASLYASDIARQYQTVTGRTNAHQHLSVTLPRMEANGWIKSRRIARESRTVWSLTKSGRAAYVDAAKQVAP